MPPLSSPHEPAVAGAKDLRAGPDSQVARVDVEPAGLDGAAQPAGPFWKQKTLEAMTPAEWESLCDGCGRCCLVKLEDEDTGQIHFTDVACKLFEAATCRCGDYAHRRRKVHDCIKLTPAAVRTLTWLPPSCAYRLLAEGRDLAWWHPLISGSSASVHDAGVSVRGRVEASETDVRLDDYPEHIVRWPGQIPRPVKRRAKPAKL